jgi:hypothetical protein
MVLPLYRNCKFERKRMQAAHQTQRKKIMQENDVKWSYAAIDNAGYMTDIQEKVNALWLLYECSIDPLRMLHACVKW